MQRPQDGAGAVIKSRGRIIVADFSDRLAGGIFRVVQGIDGLLIVHGDFAGQHDQAGGHQRFAGDTGQRIGRQQRIHDGIGDLVGDLVRVSHGDRLGGEQMAGSEGTGGNIGHDSALQKQVLGAMRHWVIRRQSCGPCSVVTIAGNSTFLGFES